MPRRLWMEHANGLPRPDLRRVAGFAHGFLDVTDAPAATIQASRPVHILIEEGGDVSPVTVPPGKPPYRVPSMAEIRALPWNGLRVASLFAGAGGSSTGYRMAGFRVAYANEFVEAAADTYRANMAPETILDQRDIRSVSPESILERLGLAKGELDLLDGSPPCSSFSTAGKGAAGWGKVKAYSDTEQRTDDLFAEFARILRGIQPKAFNAENVSGLVKGQSKGQFLRILESLKAAGYRVEAKLLDAQWLGVPQARQRLIFSGVRLDLGLAPAHPRPLPYRYSVREALPWLERLTGGNKAPFDSKGRAYDVSRPCPTVMGGDTLGLAPFQFIVEGEEGRAPPVEPESSMEGYAVGEAWDETAPGEASSRYFSLKRPHPDRPSQCVTARGGLANAASVTHPTEKRKFSIAELRRICAFPDDFVLTGTYAQQWERLGRSVPPVMMAAIAREIRDRILLPAAEREKAA